MKEKYWKKKNFGRRRLFYGEKRLNRFGDMFELKNKIALITGSQQGIGREIALVLARAGARVVVTDLDEGKCEKVVAEIKKAKGKASAKKLDITNYQEFEKRVQETIKEHGRLDILVNNAGIYIQKDLTKMTLEEIDKIIKVNFYGAVYGCRAILPHLKKRKQGRIINIASTAGFASESPLSAIYCATKGALIDFTRQMALDLAPYKINVNAIAPGKTETKMLEARLKNNKGKKQKMLAEIPLGKFSLPKDTACACLYLASDEANHITGHTLVVDGGWLIKYFL